MITPRLTMAWLLPALLLFGATPARAQTLKGPLTELAPLLGTWEIEAKWRHGATLWARAQYSPGIGGHSVEGRVFVQDNQLPPYLRYLNVFRFDDDGELVATNFSHDGTQTESEFEFLDGVMSSTWMEGELLIRERTATLGEDKLHWTVTMSDPETENEQTLMDAYWTRKRDAGMTRPIDTTLFVSGEPTTSFVKEAVIAAPVEAVYAAWTDPAAFKAAYDPGNPELDARIDLEIGGRFEWLWDGTAGSNDCQVLSFIPNRMLSFSWNAPPEQIASRAQRSFVVVEFEPTQSGGTKLRLTHQGFGQREHWQQTQAYFEKAWPVVIGNFAKHLEAAQR